MTALAATSLETIHFGPGYGVPELRKIPHLRLVTDNAQMAFTEWACSPEKIRY
jgi:hypothetical protein